MTWGLFSRRTEPGRWRSYADLLEETAAAGGRMFAQVHSRALTVVLSFQDEPALRPPARVARAAGRCRSPSSVSGCAIRRRARRLIEAAAARADRPAIGAEARAGAYDWIFVMDTVEGPHRTVAEVAQERGVDPVEAMIDLALEKDLERFFLQPIANEDQETRSS